MPAHTFKGSPVIALIRTVTVTVFYPNLIVYSSCMYLSATFNLPVVSSLSHSFSNTTITKVNTTGITTARVIWNQEDTQHVTDILLSLHILKFRSVDTRIWNTNCHLNSATKMAKYQNDQKKTIFQFRVKTRYWRHTPCHVNLLIHFYSQTISENCSVHFKEQ